MHAHRQPARDQPRGTPGTAGTPGAPGPFLPAAPPAAPAATEPAESTAPAESTERAESTAPSGPTARTGRVWQAESRPRAAGGPRGACDVLVVGGGIVGLVTAWRAAGRGLATTVVDPDPGGGAARVAAGMLAAVTELHYGEEALLDLNLAAARRYPTFAAELAEVSGQRLGYRACGTLAVALDADDRAQLRELHAFQRHCGLDAQWLSGRECRRLEPMLAPGVTGGVRVDGDHQVDPRRLLAALVTACERTGVAFHRSVADRLTVVGDRATGAVLGDGTRLVADRTVLAAGSHSGRLAGLPDAVVPPVRPVKGQVVRLHMAGPYRGLLSRTVRAVVRGQPVYLVPRESGELVVGATSEELGWDTTVTAGGVYALLRDAHELVPAVSELPLAETCAGLRPGSPDNAPLLGPTALPGLYLATGHHRNGVLLAAVTGDALADVLAGGDLPAEVRPFTPQRFPGRHAPSPAPQEQPA